MAIYRTELWCAQFDSTCRRFYTKVWPHIGLGSSALSLTQLVDVRTQKCGHISDCAVVRSDSLTQLADVPTQRCGHISHWALVRSDSFTQLDVPTQRCGHISDWGLVRSDAGCLALERMEDMPGLFRDKGLLCQMMISQRSETKLTVTSQNTMAISLSDLLEGWWWCPLLCRLLKSVL